MLLFFSREDFNGSTISFPLFPPPFFPPSTPRFSFIAASNSLRRALPFPLFRRSLRSRCLQKRTFLPSFFTFFFTLFPLLSPAAHRKRFWFIIFSFLLLVGGQQLHEISPSLLFFVFPLFGLIVDGRLYCSGSQVSFLFLFFFFFSDGELFFSFFFEFPFPNHFPLPVFDRKAFFFFSLFPPFPFPSETCRSTKR